MCIPMMVNTSQKMTRRAYNGRDSPGRQRKRDDTLLRRQDQARVIILTEKLTMMDAKLVKLESKTSPIFLRLLRYLRSMGEF